MMTENTGTGTVDEALTPESVFALIGNEFRAEILRTLGEAQGQEGPPPILSLSELHSRADVAIDSSQFNYHLQQLVGYFVNQTDDGYQLRHEGTTLYRTILAGTFTRHASVPSFDVGITCYFCETEVVATYDNGRFSIHCPGCKHVYDEITAPPSVADADNKNELLSRLDQYSRHRVLAFSHGVCSICVNSLDTQFLSGPETGISGGDHLDVFVHRSCGHCGAQQYMSVGMALLYRPELVSFFHERGLDVTTTPIWELEFAMTDRHVAIRSTDPWEVVLRLTRAGDTLELVVDDELATIERNHL